MIGIEQSEDLAPGGILIPAEREKLIKACLASSERKRRAWARWLIYTEAHAPLIYERLRATLNDEAYRDEVVKHIDLSDNAALDAMHDICTVWSQGPRRSVAGASESEASAFNTLVVESLVDVHGQEWNEEAEFVGPIIVVPAVRKGKLRWDVLLPTYTEVTEDPEDKFGTPLAAAWPIHGTKPESPGGHIMVLDGHGWSKWRIEGGRQVQVGETIEHGLGRFPGVPLRFDTPHACDYYGHPSRNQRFVDATIAVGAIRSVLAFTRKAQNGKLLAAIGFLGDAVKQQPLDPETGIAINIKPTPGGQMPTATVQTLDFDTPPTSFVEHANDYRRSVASAYGGTIAEDGRMVFDTKALTEQRRRQVPRARVFCRDLWINAIELCRQMRHPLAALLPDVEKVRAGFAVDFGTMSREFADPAKEAEHKDWLRRNGAITQLDIMRDQGNENLDVEQLKEKVQDNLDVLKWFNDEVTKRDLSMVAGNAATAPQAFGALGPIVRDAPRNAPEGAPEKKPEGNEDERSRSEAGE
jgi:hypothetical protein